MPYDSWTCLMVEDGPGLVPDMVRDALKMTACLLHLERRDRTLISSDVCDGTVSTEWATHAVGSRSGILFRASISASGGDWRVNFLLHTRDLECGADILREREAVSLGPWRRSEGRIPCAALYEFSDLSRARRILH